MAEEKIAYVKPTNLEEVKKVLEGLPTETYSRLKGRGLGLIEKWYPTDKVQQQAARDSYLLLLSVISGALTRKITDCIEVLSNGK